VTNSAYSAPAPARLRRFNPARPLGLQDYADLWLDFPLGRVLDYGCGPGVLLRRLVSRAAECWGVDVDAAELASAGAIDGVRIEQIAPGQRLPFEDASFDTVVISEVIEHVADERMVLADLTRVLRPGGRLLLTTPHKGLLTFLDPGNLKFVVPGLHRFVHRTLLRRGASYEARFGEQRRRETGLVGDITAGASAWHRHYTYEEIRRLAPPELETLAWRVYFPGMRAIWCTQVLTEVVTRGRVRSTPPPFNWMYRGLSRCETRAGDQLVVLFEKTGVARASCP
jgi:ubiquinone/menaquinone biosynthesis C-methylase UbiE